MPFMMFAIESIIILLSVIIVRLWSLNNSAKSHAYIAAV